MTKRTRCAAHALRGAFSVSVAGAVHGILALGLTWLTTKTADADEADHWIKVQTEPYRLNNKQDALAFANATVGLYGNGTGRIYRTQDGGARWQQIWSHQGTYVRALEFIDDKSAVLGNVGPGYFPGVTDPTPLYITRDAGASWKPATFVAGPPIRGICAIDVVKQEGKVLAIRAGGRVGGPSAMAESFDGGATWHSRDMSAVTGMILDIHFLDASTGFLAGASQSDERTAHARILKTTDGGASWRAVYASSRSGDNNWKLAFPSHSVGYATIISYRAPPDEARGYVVKTVDAGEHWRKLTVTRDQNWVPYGINFVDPKHGWVGGSTGGFETTDGGERWHRVEMGLSTNKMRILALPDGGRRVFAIGHDIYRLDLAPPRR